MKLLRLPTHLKLCSPLLTTKGRAKDSGSFAISFPIRGNLSRDSVSRSRGNDLRSRDKRGDQERNGRIFTDSLYRRYLLKFVASLRRRVFEAFRTYHASSLFLDITSTRMHASTQIHRSQDCKEIEGDFFFQPSQTVSLLLWNQNEGQGEAEHESAFGGCFAPLLTRCLTSIMLL